jgi:hypothetical protein
MSRARDLGSSINSTAAGKNLVINGNFEISQRYSTPSTLTYCNSSMFFVDRWCPHQFQSANLARTSIAAGSGPVSRYGLKVASTTLAQEGYGSRVVVAQKIESINVYPLRGHRVTLSFWVRFSNSNFASLANSTDSTYGNFAYSIGYNTTTTDAAIGSTGSDSANYAEIANSNASGSLPTSWTKITLNGTVPLDANNILVRFGFNALGSSTSQGQYWYEIADVQLEKGSSATPFSLAGGDIQGELSKCQRYYYQTDSYITFAHSSYNTGNYISSHMQFPVIMRIAPTISIFDVAGNSGKMTQYPNGSTVVSNITTPSAVTIKTTHWFYEAGGTSNGNQGGGVSALRYLASAEI